jgi:hypothetical protein
MVKTATESPTQYLNNNGIFFISISISQRIIVYFYIVVNGSFQVPRSCWPVYLFATDSFAFNNLSV